MQIGIIAGMGELPVIIAGDARDRGYRVVTVALENLASPELSGVSDAITWINAGKLGGIIDTLKMSGVREAIMAGKVPKALIYKSGITPDFRAVKLLFSLKDKSDDSILNGISSELKKDGISVIDTAAFSPHLLTPEGVLTKRRPSEDEWEDIKFGWKIALQLGRLDIGQTVVIKGKAVMAVEAIEGTDEAILRGGRWAGEGAVVVKISKPQQDMRLDVPTAGRSTIESMVSAGAKVLAMEAHRSILINRDAVVAEADKAGIAIVGGSGE
jgi:hypothetical protein